MKRTILLVSVILLLFALTFGLVAAPGGTKIEGSPTPAPAISSQPVNIEVDQTGYEKGFYVSYNALGSSEFVDKIKNLLESTELNAVVMDFKGDLGYLTFPSSVPLAQEIGADQQTTVQDPAEFLRWFKDRKVYLIARIVVMKDEKLTEAHPEWAVHDSATGGVWHDKDNLGWVDPNLPAVWDYNVALAAEAAKMGFDEVQYDYVRFPTDGQVGQTVYSVGNTMENRVAALTNLFERTRNALAPYGTKLGVDVFGYTAWTEDDLGIGQQMESIAPYLDVLSPMLYPSTFSFGLPGELPEYDNAIAYPYEIVNKSTERAVRRAKSANPQIVVRPWIQDFGDYAFDYRDYTPGEIRLQMDGARDAGGRGWLLWDPAVIYTPEALMSANPSYMPNTSGKVMILAYQQIGEPEGKLQRTPANFRADLERLLAAGFYPVNLRDMVEGPLKLVPAGKRPVILTFDGSTPDQYRLLPNGTVDPDSAVGILRSFHDAHPMEWPLRATFFVTPGAPGTEPGQAIFGQAESALQKLQSLVAWDMEVGLRTGDETDLSRLAPEEVQGELARGQGQLKAWLPEYSVVSLLASNGRYPKDKSLVAQGASNGSSYAYLLAVGPAKGLSPSPHTPDFDPYYISRVQATASELDRWLKAADQPGFYYVSAGE